MEDIPSCENPPRAEKPLFDNTSRRRDGLHIVVYLPTWLYLGLIASLGSFVLIGAFILCRVLVFLISLS